MFTAHEPSVSPPRIISISHSAATREYGSILVYLLAAANVFFNEPAVQLIKNTNKGHTAGRDLMAMKSQFNNTQL